jgi:hypothetical protein
VAVIRSTEVVGDQQVAILIEVDDVPAAAIGGLYGETRGERLEKVVQGTKDVFEAGLDLARTCASQAVQGIEKLGREHRPDEFQLTLAIKLDAEAGAILAKYSAGAQMQVTMTWRRS